MSRIAVFETEEERQAYLRKLEAVKKLLVEANTSFRAWYDGHMYKVLAIDFENRSITMCRLDDETYRVTNTGSVFDETILRRPTGLKDKNGLEIYEGDVLEGPAWKRGHERREVVEWDNGQTWDSDGAFGVMGGYVVFHSLPRDAEVIGNIYENPELLEQAA